MAWPGRAQATTVACASHSRHTGGRACHRAGGVAAVRPARRAHGSPPADQASGLAMPAGGRGTRRDVRAHPGLPHGRPGVPAARYSSSVAAEGLGLASWWPAAGHQLAAPRPTAPPRGQPRPTPCGPRPLVARRRPPGPGHRGVGHGWPTSHPPLARPGRPGGGCAGGLGVGPRPLPTEPPVAGLAGHPTRPTWPGHALATHGHAHGGRAWWPAGGGWWGGRSHCYWGSVGRAAGPGQLADSPPQPVLWQGYRHSCPRPPVAGPAG